MPEHETLFSTWDTIPNKKYPTASLDSDSPISGLYSLKIRSHIGSELFFLRKIEHVSGFLSFSIKCLYFPTTVSLHRFDYDNNGLIISPTEYLIKIKDNQIHNYKIFFPKGDYNIISSLYYIAFPPGTFYFDNLCFFSEQNITENN